MASRFQQMVVDTTRPNTINWGEYHKPVPLILICSSALRKDKPSSLFCFNLSLFSTVQKWYIGAGRTLYQDIGYDTSHWLHNLIPTSDMLWLHIYILGFLQIEPLSKNEIIWSDYRIWQKVSRHYVIWSYTKSLHTSWISIQDLAVETQNNGSIFCASELV